MGASQVPPLSFSHSFSFQFGFNLNYETKRLKTGSQTPATTEKRRTEKKRKKQSASQMIDLVMTIQTVQESSKSELSSRFLSTSKFGPPRNTLAQGHTRLFAQGQGWLTFSIQYSSTERSSTANLSPMNDIIFLLLSCFGAFSCLCGCNGVNC